MKKINKLNAVSKNSDNYLTALKNKTLFSGQIDGNEYSISPLSLMLKNLNLSYDNIIEIVTFSKNIRNNLQNILEHILSLDQESTKHQKQIKEFWDILEEYYKSVLYIEEHEKKVLDANQKANAKIMEIYNLQ